MDPTGQQYRYTEDGVVVYLDARTRREYYYDHSGNAVWLR